MAADKTGGFKDGGLYGLANPQAASSAVAWTKLSGGLEAVISAEAAGRRTAPIDFLLDPGGGGVVYVATASFQATNGGGGLYARDAGGSWSKLPIPFEDPANNYNDGLQAFGAYFVGDVLFATSTSHGTWWRSPAQPTTWTEYKALPFLRPQRIATTIDPATGTIGPGDGDASLWFSTFGGGAWEVRRRCGFITDHSTISKYEADAALAGGNGTVARVAYLELDGFLGAEAGLPTTADVPQLTVTVPGIANPAVTAVCRSPQHDVPDMDTPHRITLTCDLVFTGTSAFPTNPAATQLVELEFRQGPYVCRTSLTLTLPPHPYILDGPTPWLSQDVQLFAVKEGDAPYDGIQLATTAAGTGAPDDSNDAAAVARAFTYLTKLLNAFNGGSTTFDAIAAGAVPVRPIQIWRLDSQSQAGRLFNFCVAKVRCRGAAAAADVRVFFRLCAAAGASFVYDASYRDDRPSGAPVPRVPLLGLKASASASANDIVSIPCFGSARVETDQSVAGARSMRAQPDDAPNVQTLPASAGAAETVRYFGCLLDLNQPRRRFALNPPVGQEDGPWTDTPQDPLMSVQDLIRGRHQCLTEEVHYSSQNGPDALRAGDTPGSSDCFSQRNLVILGSDNPGGGASHVVQHTFEVRGARLRSGGRAGSDERPRGRIRLPNDELLLWWNDVPDGTLATIAFGGIGADDILALERRRPEASRLTRVDPDTIACVVGGLTHIPLPPTERDVPALVTLTLPDDVRYGQQFSVLVQQVGMPERAILGTFEVSVRVEQPVNFLGDEQDTLAVMRHVQGRTGAEDRWSPIVARYVSQLAEKVNALGGDATAIPPSPRGAPTRRAKGCAALLWAMLRRASRL